MMLARDDEWGALAQRIIYAVLFAAPNLPEREAAMLIAAIYMRMRTCG